MRNLIYRLKYRYGKHLKLDAPVDMSLELASLCNMRCTYCYHADGSNLPFTRGFMSYEMAERALRQAASLGVESVKFNYRGEATLNPRFSDILHLAKSLAKGSTFQDRILNSNFKFKSDRTDIFEALCTLTKVKVSYDSFTKEVFERQRAGGNHDLTTDNIATFHDRYLTSSTTLVLQAVKTNLNKFEDLRKLQQERFPKASLSVRDMVEGRVNKSLDRLKHKSRDFSQRQSCLQAHVRLIVHHDGKVSPCCPSINNDLIIGEFPKQNLYEIFNSFEARALRRGLKKGWAFETNPCKTCPSFESFKGYRHPWQS